VKMALAASRDTEITLGTGKMLVLFFGLVALCAVFFGMGFSFGRTSVKAAGSDPVTSTTPANGPVRPTAVRSPNANPSPSADLTFYKTVGQSNSDAQLATNDRGNNTQDTAAAAKNDDAANPPALNGYYVQVAAVSKQEDAEALVDALKKKQYAAFAGNAPTDKLFHVQVGPYPDIKDAESIRARLVGDGYNPILKK
jgi:cell division septation protein DedD